MSDVTAIFLGIAMLLGNAFFVGAEFAVMTARHSQIEPLAAKGRPGARMALFAVEHVSRMLACAQFGVTVCSVTLGAVAEPAIAHLLEPLLHATGISPAFAHPIAFVIALMIASYLHVVFGEMIPKNLSIAVPVQAVLILAPPLVLISKVFGPVIWILNGIANSALRILRVEPRDEVESEYTADQIAAIVDESRREGLLADDQGLLSGAIEFSDRTAREIMVPMEDVVTVTYDVTPEDFDDLVARTGYSRIGVRNDADDLVGYLHLKDVLLPENALDDSYSKPVHPGKVRAVVSVSDTDAIEEVLRAMQFNGAHLARVDSAAARSIGAVFLEDVLEELVGEVHDVMQRHPA
ncbi:hemolysin family protein [Devriesea agamarum]|uniref:hemolysin family protein n=1 Tax=Devriesea agamarum TaxID=472569 RepID=UPI00071CB98E|nr:hemolysin family protein [Devriesea agamarum]